jgi:PIN domain nuclease of toxin-antitoxin system
LRILLDTHAFLWAALEPRKLSDKVQEFIVGDQGPLLSSASLWEIAIKVKLGKLPIRKPAEWLRTAVNDLRLTVLPLRANHAIRTLSLPDHHKDPFDRIIVAQAMEEGLAIATTDDKIKKYAVDIFW